MTTENTQQHDSRKPFADYGFNPQILKDIEAMGFEHPTPIQAAGIPPALEGKDVIGLAQTGTGKTAAFGLPMIQRVGNSPDLKGLVLAPTRELAQQIAEAMTALGRSSGVRIATIVGGIKMANDHRALASWPNIVVATPGRLIDHIYSRTIVLDDIEIFAVDEADRMYDMGFMPQIRQIVEVLPPKRQTLMFTATMPDEVEQLVRRHMHNPERVQIGIQAPAERAKQELFDVHENHKDELLLELLKNSDGRVLVFARTKRKVDKIASTVRRRRHSAQKIHGDRAQNQRTEAMQGFREGKYRILIATDIAARGIDVADIEHVINYDFPGCAEDYIHRIGRTARVAASGLATSFVTSQDRQCLTQLERMIDEKLELTPVKGGDQTETKRAGGRGRGGRGRSRSGGGGRPRAGASANANASSSSSSGSGQKSGRSRRRGGRGRKRSGGKPKAS